MKPSLTAAALAFIACAAAGCAPVALVGTSAVVVHSVAQERSTMDALTDTEIGLSLANRLANHSGQLYRDVSVDVVEGRVVLTGSVPDREDKIAATRIAWETPGVLEVSDELTVAEDSGTRAYIADAAISNRIRYELLTDLDVRSVNYNVETVDGVVHLTGIARSERELGKVVGHARSVNGVNQVVSHVLTIDDPRRTAAIVNRGAVTAGEATAATGPSAATSAVTPVAAPSGTIATTRLPG